MTNRIQIYSLTLNTQITLCFYRYQDSVKTLKPLSTVAASMAQSNRVLAIAPDNNFTRSFANWLCEQNPGIPLFTFFMDPIGFDPKKAFPTKGDLFDYLKVPSMKNYIKFFDTSEAIYEYFLLAAVHD